MTRAKKTAVPPNTYADFLQSKALTAPKLGMATVPPLADHLFKFQREAVSFGLERGSWGCYLDTGLGKTAAELEWSIYAAEASNGKALILTPLAVARQIEAEGRRWGYDIRVIREQSEAKAGINVCNYDRLHLIEPDEFGSVALDEAGIIKNFTGATTRALIAAFAGHRWRMAATATPAPNDHTELAQHASFLGVMTRDEMLVRWFINDSSDTKSWRLKGYAVEPFFDWMASWARMAEHPRDLGDDMPGFDLLPLDIRRHQAEEPDTPIGDGLLFGADVSATGIHTVKRATTDARADVVAKIVTAEDDQSWIVWCDTDYESQALADRMPMAQEVRGSHSTERKEDIAEWFVGKKCLCKAATLGMCNCGHKSGYRILISKPSIFGQGLNFQHCARMVFVGRSFCFDEETEILTRRGWRSFGEVTTDDEVAAITPDDLQMEWQRPTRVTWEPYSGEMIQFGGSRSFNLLVTPNHRMLVKRCDVRFPGTATGEWEFKEADDLERTWKRQEYRLPSIPSGWNGQELQPVEIPVRPGYHWSSRSKVVKSLTATQIAKLAGWYVSEGHVRQNHRVLVISQTDKHPDHRAEIIDLLTGLGLNVNYRTKDIYVCSTNLCDWLVDQFGNGSYEKRLPSWLKDSDTRTLTLLRDIMIKGDGCHGSDGTPRAYRSYSQQLQDDFQEICLKTGMKASVRREWGGVVLGHEFKEPSLSIRPGRVEYSGMIGCVTVPAGAVLVRRNGTPVISGNSYEQWYQAVRRCWRFGQKRRVQVHLVVAEGEDAIGRVIDRKADDHVSLKAAMRAAMARAIGRDSARKIAYHPTHAGRLPAFLEHAR